MVYGEHETILYTLSVFEILHNKKLKDSHPIVSNSPGKSLVLKVSAQCPVLFASLFQSCIIKKNKQKTKQKKHKIVIQLNLEQR